MLIPYCIIHTHMKTQRPAKTSFYSYAMSSVICNNTTLMPLCFMKSDTNNSTTFSHYCSKPMHRLLKSTNTDFIPGTLKVNC